MTIRGTGEYLTDGQWITLMKIMCDDKECELTLPGSPQKDAILIRDGLRWEIHPDGTSRSVKHG